jgi:hypothetical protein
MRAVRLLADLPVVAAFLLGLELAVPGAFAANVVPWHSVTVSSPPGGGYAQLVAITCAGAQSCEAGGSYSPGKSGTRDAMIAADVKGHWTRAVRIRLPANEASSIQDATLSSVACPSARSCVAVGYYTWGTNIKQGLITTGHGVSWSTGRAPLLPSDVQASEGAYLTGVSCPAAGSCTAVGGYGYATGSGGEAMAVAMTRGRWQRAVAIRPPTNAYVAPSAHLDAVSCTAAGQCAAVGGYTDRATDGEPLAAMESRGKWGRAVEVGLPADASREPQAQLYAVSCVRNLYCEAAGEYVTKYGYQAGFVEAETRGRWRTAMQIFSLPGGAKTSPPLTELGGISCIPAECIAVGTYENDKGGYVPMTVLGSGRIWERARSFGLPRGAASGGAENAELSAVTCIAADHYCYGAGDYNLLNGTSEAMAAAGGI